MKLKQYIHSCYNELLILNFSITCLSFLSITGSLEDSDDPITELHFQLFNNIGRRPIDKENWIFFASKVHHAFTCTERCIDLFYLMTYTPC